MPERAPSDFDLAVRSLALDELARFDPGLAEVRFEWSDDAGFWSVSIVPTNGRAAPMTLAAEDESTLNCTFGSLWIEIFGPIASGLPHLRLLVGAVLAGRFEEVGRRPASFGRFLTTEGLRTGGDVHLPWPWKWRRVRRFPPYGEPR